MEMHEILFALALIVALGLYAYGSLHKPKDKNDQNDNK